ncbi:MAG: LAGLIDADG family homing endonuclease, partial [bacterium]|nr:LAGLIDADG family homing endonuclease [bacterium]
SILEEIKRYFNCGFIKSNCDKSGTWVYIVKDIKSLEERILPFFDKHPPIVKKEQFARFKKVVRIIANKEHLKQSGKTKIKNIKLGASETICWDPLLSG